MMAQRKVEYQPPTVSFLTQASNPLLGKEFNIMRQS